MFRPVRALVGERRVETLGIPERLDDGHLSNEQLLVQTPPLLRARGDVSASAFGVSDVTDPPPHGRFNSESLGLISAIIGSHLRHPTSVHRAFFGHVAILHAASRPRAILVTIQWTHSVRRALNTVKHASGRTADPRSGRRSVTISEWKGYVRACRENRGLQFGRLLFGSRSSTRSFLAARRRPSSRRSVTGSSRILIGGRTPSRPTNRGASNITKGSAKPLVAEERLHRLMTPHSIICLEGFLTSTALRTWSHSINTEVVTRSCITRPAVSPTGP